MGHNAAGVSRGAVICNDITTKYAGSAITNRSRAATACSAVAVDAGITDSDARLAIRKNPAAMARGAVAINT